MFPSFEHCPVLLQESIDALNIKADGVYIDCTFGRGGHSQLILNQLNEAGKLIALDHDLDAVNYARHAFSNEPRFEILHASFSSLDEIVNQNGLIAKVSGILIDLGVSSPQLDQADRGFSFKYDGPLDMRMDQRLHMTAADWLNTASVDEMSCVFKEYGEEKYAKRIARRIAEVRTHSPLRRTQELAELVNRCVPNKSQQIHPATRIFQAIRIHINDELGALRSALQASLNALKTGGRLVVISFHSLEDRIVKRFLRGEPEALELRRLPIQVESARPFRIIGKLVRPGELELANNPRARSARMRVGERV